MIVSDSRHYYNTTTGEEYGPTLYAMPKRDQYGRDITHRLWFAFMAVSKPLFKRRETWFIAGDCKTCGNLGYVINITPNGAYQLICDCKK